MVASPEMRAIRELPLAASLLLVGCALFFGGAAQDGSLPWLGGGALLLLVGLLALQGVPRGWPFLLPLAALVAWLALSISWSTLPDRSWDYADRGLVYLLFAAAGVWLAGRRRELALGLAALLGAVAAWALLGKVLPFLYPDYQRAARLRGPVGLWNQLALLAAFALPLALWRRRASGALLAYAWIVALVLTYSRGGLVTAVVVVGAWFVLTDERADGAATLAAAVLPAAVVVGIAFVLPGVTSDGQSSATRWRDGLIFGGLLLVGAVGAAALSRAPRPRLTPAMRRALVGFGALVIVAIVAVGVLKTGSSAVGQGPQRLGSASSNFRFVWWRQAVHGWEQHRLAGTGAGTFELTNLRFRASYLDKTIEPHNLPLQFLTEAGVVGLLLFGLACAALLRPVWRRPRGHELALALILPAYLVHGLVDIDWDFAAVSAPAFLVAGALAGGAQLRRVSPFALMAASGVALLAWGVLLLPWLGERWANDALGASPARAVRLADRAQSVDPFLVEPYWAKAFAADLRNQPQRAFAYYVQAVHRQPANDETWLAAGEYAFGIGCYQTAFTYLERYTELNQKALPSEGGDHYNRARDLVDAGKGRC
jgi:O-antigen ligase